MVAILFFWVRSYWAFDGYSGLTPLTAIWSNGVEMELRSESTKPTEWYRSGMRPTMRTGWHSTFSATGRLVVSTSTREWRFLTPKDFEAYLHASHSSTPAPNFHTIDASRPDVKAMETSFRRNPAGKGFCFLGFLHQEFEIISGGQTFRESDLQIPYWMPSLVLGLLLWLCLRSYYRSWRGRDRNGLCRKCNYDLRASTDRCPECGHPIPATATARPQAANDTAAAATTTPPADSST